MKDRGGLLIYRIKDNRVEVLISHHGGPLWAKKDKGAWSIIKGEMNDGEEIVDTARREFEEETGQKAPPQPWIPLGTIKRKDGKIIHAWAAEGDYDPATITSNTFTMEWPPRSGKMQEFPENDRAQWFDLRTAIIKLHTGQDYFIRQLAGILREKYPQTAVPDPDTPDELRSSSDSTLF